MDNLPPGILLDIFLECLGSPSAYLSERFERIETFLVPLRVSHVCQRWRKLALSHGGLWSHLSMVYHSNGRRYRWPRQQQTMLDVFDTWLQRTRNVSLNFAMWCSIDDRSVDGEEKRRAGEHVVRTLLANQRRWKDVCFMWGGFKPSPAFPDGVFSATDMPLLTSLVLGVGNYFIEPDREVMHAHIDISRSPLLQKLSVRGLNTIEVGEEPIHSLVGPIDIQVESNDADLDRDALRYLKLLKAAPNLRHFCINCLRIMGPSLTVPEGTHTLALRDLRSLQLAAFSLDKLIFPNLEALEYAHDDPSGGETLYHFVKRSLPPLTCLILAGSCANEETLIPTLHLLPSLRHLSINHESISAQFFRELTVVDNDSTLEERLPLKESVICPELQYLSLQDVIDEEEGTEFVDALAAMLTSRWKAFGLFGKGICLHGYLWLHLPISEQRYEVLRNCVLREKCTFYAASDESHPLPFPPEY